MVTDAPVPGRNEVPHNTETAHVVEIDTITRSGLVDNFGLLAECGYLNTYTVTMLTSNMRPFGYGFPEEVINGKKSVSEFLDELRKAYIFRREHLMLDQSDPYDFALIEYQLSKARAERLNIDEEAIEAEKYIQFLGSVYRKALAAAVIEERLEYGFKSPPRAMDLLEVPVGSADQLRELYKEYLSGNCDDLHLLKPMLNMIGSIEDVRASSLKDEVDGWRRALSLALELEDAYALGPEHSPSASRLTKIIDTIHTTTHNGGGLMSHMVGQYGVDRDTLMLMELHMKGNLAMIYEKSSSYVKDLFERMGGNKRELVSQDAKDRQGVENRYNDDYLNSLYISVIDVLRRIEHGETSANPESIMSGIAQELGLNYGIKARQFIDDLEEVVRSVMLLWYPTFRKNYGSPIPDESEITKAAENTVDMVRGLYYEGVLYKAYRDQQNRVMLDAELIEMLDEYANSGEISFWDVEAKCFY